MLSFAILGLISIFLQLKARSQLVDLVYPRTLWTWHLFQVRCFSCLNF